MRKIFYMLAIAICMTIGFSGTVMAMSKTEKRMEEIEKEIRLNPSISAGSYYEDDILHIIPLEDSINEIIKVTDIDETLPVCFDEPATYSLKDIENARDLLSENEEKLDITGFNTNILKNGIEISAESWTKSKKTEVFDLLDFNNITFLDDEGVIQEDEDYIDNYNDKYLLNSVLSNRMEKARLGYRIIEDTNGHTGNICTLGGCVITDSGDYAIITTAHGLSIGDQISVSTHYDNENINGFLGTVIDKKMGGNLDVAVIDFDNSSNFEPSALTYYDEYVGSVTEGSINKTYYIYGSQNEKIPVILKDFDATHYWNDPTHNDVKKYKNMLKFEFADDMQTNGGDSGTPILRQWKDGSMSIVGIYKGRTTENGEVYAYGSSFVNIIDYFDVKPYQQR